MSSLPTEEDDPSDILKAVDEVKHRQQGEQDNTIENTADIANTTDVADIANIKELTDIGDIEGVTGAADLSNVINLEDRVSKPVTADVADIPDIPTVQEEVEVTNDVNPPQSIESLEMEPIIYEEELEDISDIEAKLNQELLHVNEFITMPIEMEHIEETIPDISVEEVTEKKGKCSS
ncbi:hypothetical protein ACFQZ1_08795 [Bacillus sp. CGMCC 1.60114]|uniref:hypothetical protein n=1 Tax=unclassified Bacillus (in: firmicutes) TaxID=185979 RepID=UPI00363EE0DC